MREIEHNPNSSADIEATYCFKEEERGDLQDILRLLERSTGVEYPAFREATILRRLEKSCQNLKFKSLTQLLDHLVGNPDALEAIHEDLLIGVTNFFRDGEVFEAVLNKVFPKMVQDRKESNGPLRLWIAGCSKGEEAYSIAICLHEAFRQQKLRPEYVIFATDINRESVKAASTGIYPDIIEQHIPGNLLENYFDKFDQGYVVKSILRQRIIFSVHDCCQNPPFTKLDFISCRNMLIYFEPALQEKALNHFHFGLRQDAILLLGKSESLGAMSDGFSPVYRDLNIHRKNEMKRAFNKVSLTMQDRKSDPIHMKAVRTQLDNFKLVGKNKFTQEAKILREFARTRFAPTLVLSEKLEVIYLLGDVQKYLTFPSGKTSMNVESLLGRNMAVAIKNLVHHVELANESPVLENVNLNVGSETFKFDLQVFKFSIEREKYYSLEIREKKVDETSYATIEYNQEEQDYYYTRELENKIQRMESSLQEALENLNAANEELQCTNEELMTSNEELQSSNEELHTVNEELHTVNAEHEYRVSELSQLDCEVEMMLFSIDVAYLLLDRHGRIRKFSKNQSDFFNFLRQDVGRMLTDFEFNPEIAEILQKLDTVSQELKGQKWVLEKGGSQYRIVCIPLFEIGSTARDKTCLSGFCISFQTI